MLKKYLNNAQGVITASLFTLKQKDLIACYATSRYAQAVILNPHILEWIAENIEKYYHSKKKKVRKSQRWQLKELRNALNAVSLLKEVMAAILWPVFQAIASVIHSFVIFAVYNLNILNISVTIV